MSAYPSGYGTFQTSTGQSSTGYVYNDPMTGGLVNSNGQRVYPIG